MEFWTYFETISRPLGASMLVMLGLFGFWLSRQPEDMPYRDGVVGAASALCIGMATFFALRMLQ